MNYNIKILLITFITLFLNACVTTGNNVISSAKEKIFDAGGNDNNVGLNLVEENIYQDQEEVQYLSSHRNLNIVVPTFDPGIENDEKVFQELRNFESRRFAVKLKTALEDTNRLGAVRVTPNTSASGQIYVLGKIKASNGQKVKIKVKVIDASGKKIMDKNFSKKLMEVIIVILEQKNTDAYNPLFEEVAEKIVEKIEKLNSKRVNELVNISNLRFGAEFSPESFNTYFEKKK